MKKAELIKSYMLCGMHKNAAKVEEEGVKRTSSGNLVHLYDTLDKFDKTEEIACSLKAIKKELKKRNVVKYIIPLNQGKVVLTEEKTITANLKRVLKSLSLKPVGQIKIIEYARKMSKKDLVDILEFLGESALGERCRDQGKSAISAEELSKVYSILENVNLTELHGQDIVFHRRAKKKLTSYMVKHKLHLPVQEKQ